MKFTVITITRDRPNAFLLCIRWMLRQTIRDFEWIVVDDGDVQSANGKVLNKISKSIKGFKYVRLAPSGRSCTYFDNLLEAIKHVNGDNVCIVEDDDWRGVDYLFGLIRGMRESDFGCMTGFPKYHLPTRNFCFGSGEETIRLGDWDNSKYIGRMLSFNMYFRTELGIGLFESALLRGQKYKANPKRQIARSFQLFWGGVKKIGVKPAMISNREFMDVKGIPGRRITSPHVDPTKLGAVVHDPNLKHLISVVGEDDARLMIRALDEDFSLDAS